MSRHYRIHFNGTLKAIPQMVGVKVVSPDGQPSENPADRPQNPISENATEFFCLDEHEGLVDAHLAGGKSVIQIEKF